MEEPLLHDSCVVVGLTPYLPSERIVLESLLCDSIVVVGLTALTSLVKGLFWNLLFVIPVLL